MSLTKAQQEYFRYSQAKDRNGEPLVVYHGSKSKGFDAFQYSPERQTGTDFGEAYYFTTDYEKAKAYAYDQLKDPRLIAMRNKRMELFAKAEETGDRRYEKMALNITFQGRTEDQIAAAADWDTGGEVHAVYLDLRNPLIVDAQGKAYYDVYPAYFKAARDRGHDGIIAYNVSDTAIGNPRPMDVYIAFYPDQIKSVDNLFPTQSREFKDNSKEYMKENFGKMSPEDQFQMAKVMKEQSKRRAQFTKSQEYGDNNRER